MIGARLDNYRVVEKIGDGGMGSVYRAIDVMLERDVALKFLRPELAHQPDLVERFRTEAVVLARLKHAHIAAVYGLHRHGEDWFMAIEYVPGVTLDALIAREGPLPGPQAAAIGADVLDALDYAHRRGVIHRDIKTANIMVTPEGDVKVMDFGIARVLGGQRQTRVGFVVGTLSYMSPEQIQGLDVDARSDLYSVGIAVYEMLTGRPPFQADTEWKLMQAQISQPPAALRPVADVSAEIEGAVLRALQKSPDARFQSATEFRRALVSSLPGQDAAAARATATRVEEGPGAATRLTTPLPAAPPAEDLTRLVSLTPPSRPAPGPLAAATAPEARTPPPPVPAPPPAPRRRGAPAAAARSASWMSGRRTVAGVGGASLLLFLVVFGLAISGRLPAIGGPAAGSLPPPPAAPAVFDADLAGRALPVPDPVDPGALDRSGDRDAPAGPRPVRPAPEADGGARTVDHAVPEPPVQPAVTAAEPVLPPVATAGDAPPGRGTTVPGPAMARFGRVRLATTQGGETRESEVILQLDGTRLALIDRDGRTVVKAMPYGDIASATYSQSAGAGVFIFGRGARHWLTIHAGSETVLLRLDRSNQERILSEFQRLSGKPVAIDERPQ
jgi:hypothetical protein